MDLAAKHLILQTFYHVFNLFEKRILIVHIDTLTEQMELRFGKNSL